MERISTKRIKRFCDFHLQQDVSIEYAVKMCDIMNEDKNIAQISKLSHYGVFIRTLAQTICGNGKVRQNERKTHLSDFYGVYVGSCCTHTNGAWSCVIVKNGKLLRKISGKRDIDNNIGLLQLALFYAVKTLPLGAITTIYTDNDKLINSMCGDETTKQRIMFKSTLLGALREKFVDYRNVSNVGNTEMLREAYNVAEKTYKTNEPIYESYIS